MSRLPTVFIQPRKARPFFGRHPWVFDQAIDRIEGEPAPGEAVRVMSADREFIAYGLFNPTSTIRVRLVSWEKDQPIDDALLVSRLERAIRFRHQRLGMDDPRGACRLFYSESDGLPGLIVDRYADVLTIVFTSLALAQRQEIVVRTLERLLHPRGIYRRSEKYVAELEGMEEHDGLLAGTVPETPLLIREHGIDYAVDVRAGQKTGMYLDQRENRLAVCRYTQHQDVLDVCCHGGGFGLTALRHGKAKSVLGIDSSPAAVRLAQDNAERNELPLEVECEDAVPAMHRLRREGRRFGVIILDPPKFARNLGALAAARRGYDQLNRAALELLEPDGILVSCSCSGVLEPAVFVDILAEASKTIGRELHVLEERGQAADHPVSTYCLETRYLKVVIARAVG